MKNTYLLPILLLIFFISCKKEVKKIELATETKNSAIDSVQNEEEEEPEIDMGDLMNIMGGLLTDAAQDSTDQGLFTAGGEINVEFLKSEEGKPMRKVFAQIAEVSEKEVDLSLTLMPDNNIVSVKHAEEIEKDLNNSEVEAYIKSGKASDNFLDLIKESQDKAMVRTTNFKKKAQQAKDKFYKDNPSWFALDETTEDTFIDSRKAMVYLPLGELSFADSVVVFSPGEPSGFFPERCLGTSQGNASLKTDCALLGSGGSIILFFKNNAITDINGPDIFVFEKGASIEPTNLEISKNGKKWINIGKIEGGTGSKDISNFVKQGETFNYIRLTDLKTSFGPPPGADIDAVAAIGGALRLNLDSAVLFETGAHVLKEEGIKAIEELAIQMKNIKKGTITIEGHTDDVGSDTVNKTLSQKRAASVSVALKKAIDNPTFKWRELGYGESKPIVANDTDENRQKNRRVEILVTPF